MLQRPSDGGPLHQTAAQAARQLISSAAQPCSIQRVGSHLSRITQAIEPSGQREILQQRQIVVEKGLVRQETDGTAALAGPPPEPLSQHPDLSASRLCESGQDAEKGRFAGAVGAYNSERLTWPKRKIDVAEDPDSPKRLSESASC